MSLLSTKLAGLNLANPTILASGILGTSYGMLERAVAGGAGAVTIKSITREPREGHKNPITVEVRGGLLNAVGYSNMGLDAAKEEFKSVGKLGVPAFASVVAEDAEGFAHLAKELSRLPFKAVEVVLSCPHTPGLGLLAGHGTPEATGEITKAVVKASRLPVFVKLSPNTQGVGEVAKAAEKAGAAAINMGNTLGPGMVINLEAGKPVLDFKVGGMSGPAVKPIMLRCVYDVCEAVKIPVIGCGGVLDGRDAVEYLMAGASTVGVGTAVMYRREDAFKKICEEIRDFMKENGFSKIKDMVGLAHQ
ncbi:MAG: dihydroorotate dehydrogenase [Candidatus Altiarchaeota archaeon]